MRYEIRLDRSKYRASERQAADFPTSAVESDDEDKFHEIFEEMLQLVRTDGHKLGEDELEESDVILPPPDLSFAEAHREFSRDGLTRE
jgi:hypothetical protein